MTKFCIDNVENIAGTGLNAGNTSIFSFSHIFLKTSFPDSQKSGLCGKALYRLERNRKVRLTILTLSTSYTRFNTMKKNVFGKHCGKR